MPDCTTTYGRTCKIHTKRINDRSNLQIKLRSVVSSSMHPCPENWVAIGRVVVNYARAARTLSAEIKCRHCTLMYMPPEVISFPVHLNQIL